MRTEQNKNRVRKTLVIGLGGTGRDAVLNVKRKYREAYGTARIPTTEFLVFDTADSKPLTLKSGEILALEPGEFFKMTVANPQLVVEVNKEVKRWFPGDIPMRSVTRGAGQVRAVGRLALHHNANEVYWRIKSALDRLNAIKPHEPLGEFDPINASVLINVVGSLSGGTGSGTFLDVAYVCRHHMRTASDTLTAYLVLPEVFTGRPGTDNVEPNAYAALKELDMLMSRKAGSADEGFMFGGERISTRSTPFDVVFLVNNRKRRGQVIREVDELTEGLGMGIFVASGAVGQDASDVWDNLGNQIAKLDSYGDKSPHYASFGVGEVVFDTERYVEEQTRRLASRAAAALLRESGDEVGTQGEDPVRLADDLLGEIELSTISQFLSAADAGQATRFRIDDQDGFEVWQSTFDGKDAHVRREVGTATQQSASAADRVAAERGGRILDRARELAAQPNGLARAVTFLDSLAGRLDTILQGAQRELENRRERSRNAAGAFTRQVEDFQRKQKLLGRWWRGGKVRGAAENAAAAANQEMDLAVEAGRYEAAITLCTTLRSTCGAVVGSLRGLAGRLGTIQKQLERESEPQDGESRVRPFTIQLPFPEFLKEDPTVTPGEVLQWLRREQKDVFALGDEKDEEIARLLLAFASTRDSVAKLRQQDLETLFGQEYDLDQQIRLLDRVAEPLWEYETAYLDGGRGTHTIYVFGVRNADTTVLKNNRVWKMLAASHSSQPTSTNDPRRIFCYKVEAAVPAFILDRMRSYEARYKKNTLVYHVDAAWAVSAPDLWPSGNENDRGSGNSNGNGTRAQAGTIPLPDLKIHPRGQASEPRSGTDANGAGPTAAPNGAEPPAAGDNADAAPPDSTEALPQEERTEAPKSGD